MQSKEEQDQKNDIIEIEKQIFSNDIKLKYVFYSDRNNILTLIKSNNIINRLNIFLPYKLIQQDLEDIFNQQQFITHLEVEILYNSASIIKLIQKFSKQMNKLTNLQTLSLKISSVIDQQLIPTLISMIEKQNQLITLQIIFDSNIEQTLKQDLSIFSALSQLSCKNSLKNLSIVFGENQTAGEIITREIGLGLTFLTQLENLELIINKNNSLDTNKIQDLNKGFKKMINLTKFRFHIIEYAYIGIGWKEISESISKMKNLIELDILIHNYSLNSNTLQQLFESFSHLKLLSTLIFEYQSQARIRSGVYQSLEKSLSNLKGLQTLSIISEDMCSQNKQSQQAFFKCFQSLKWINNINVKIGKNTVGMNNIVSFSEGITILNKNLTSLSLIIIQEQTLRLEGFIILSDMIRTLKNLKELKLSLQTKCRIDEQCFQYIFGSLSSLQLESFILDVGEFTNLDVVSLTYLKDYLQKISELKNIQIIINENNNLTNQGFDQICQSFSKCLNLTELILLFKSNDVITSENRFGENLRFLTNLNILNLSFDQSIIINQQQISSLGKNLKYLTNLSSLYISIDKFSQVKMNMQNLKEGLSNLINLQILELKFGKMKELDGESVKMLTSGIYNLNELKELQIHIQSNEEYKFKDQIEFLNIFRNKQLNRIDIKLKGSHQIISSIDQKKGSFLQFHIQNTFINFIRGNSSEINLDNQLDFNSLKSLRDLSFLQIVLVFPSTFLTSDHPLFLNFIPQLVQLSILDLKIINSSQIIPNITLVQFGKDLRQLINLKQLDLKIHNSRKMTFDYGHEMKNTIQNLRNLKIVNMEILNLEDSINSHFQYFESILSSQNIIHANINFKASQLGSINLQKIKNQNELKELQNEINIDNNRMEEEDEKEEFQEERQKSKFQYSLTIILLDNQQITLDLMNFEDFLLRIKFNSIKIRLEDNKGNDCKETVTSIIHGLRNQTNLKKLSFKNKNDLRLDQQIFSTFVQCFYNFKQIKHLNLCLKIKGLDTFKEQLQLVKFILNMHELEKNKILLIGQFTLTNTEISFMESLLQFSQKEAKYVLIQSNPNNRIQFTMEQLSYFGEIISENLQNANDIELKIFPKIESSQEIDIFNSYYKLAESPFLNSFKLCYFSTFQKYQNNNIIKSLENFISKFQKIQNLDLNLATMIKHDQKFSYNFCNLKDVQILKINLNNLKIESQIGEEILLQISKYQVSLKELILTLPNSCLISYYSLEQFANNLSNNKDIQKIDLKFNLDSTNLDMADYFKLDQLLRKNQKINIKLHLEDSKQLFTINSNQIIMNSCIKYISENNSYQFKPSDSNFRIDLFSCLFNNILQTNQKFEFYIKESDQDMELTLKLYLNLMNYVQKEKKRIPQVILFLQKINQKKIDYIYANYLKYTKNVDSVQIIQDLVSQDKLCYKILSHQAKYLQNVTNLKITLNVNFQFRNYNIIRAYFKSMKRLVKLEINVKY